MKQFRTALILALVFLLTTSCTSESLQVSIENMPEESRIDVTVGGESFTSFMYDSGFEKPFIFPVVAANGTIVSRGFPIDSREGETVDHPHHTGLWFSYGYVNGIDYWGNSKAIPDSLKSRYGTIRLKSIEESGVEAGKGIIRVKQEWIDPEGDIPLEEEVTYIFAAGEDYRYIDRITTLTTTLPEVSFSDTKEGAFAIRVAKFLRFPSDSPQIFVDEDGDASDTPVVNNDGVNGNYVSSEGVEGGTVWGTRARWMNLFGPVDGDTVSVVIMDHPSNLNYPTYWHARTYGLFSANPFGVKSFTGGKEELNYVLKEGESLSFKHRFYVKSGGAFASGEVEKEWEKFAKNDH